MEISLALEDIVGTTGNIWKRSVGYLIVPMYMTRFLMSILWVYKKMSSFKKKKRRHIEVFRRKGNYVYSLLSSGSGKNRHIKNRENDKAIVVKH